MLSLEPSGQRTRQVGVRLATGCLTALVVLLGACDGRSDTASSSRAPSVASAEPADVVVQLGDYHLGVIPDMFVTGPELIIYGDGTTYAEFYDGADSDGHAQFRLVTGHVDDATLHDLVTTAGALPSVTPVGEAPVDGFPLLLVVGEHRWYINDLAAEPFASFLAELRATVDSDATEEWHPTRWIDRPYGINTCTVIDQPGDDPLYDAPVYPHLIDEYPLGETPCN